MAPLTLLGVRAGARVAKLGALRVPAGRFGCHGVERSSGTEVAGIGVGWSLRVAPARGELTRGVGVRVGAALGRDLGSLPLALPWCAALLARAWRL